MAKATRTIDTENQADAEAVADPGADVPSTPQNRRHLGRVTCEVVRIARWLQRIDARAGLGIAQVNEHQMFGSVGLLRGQTQQVAGRVAVKVKEHKSFVSVEMLSRQREQEVGLA